MDANTGFLLIVCCAALVFCLGVLYVAFLEYKRQRRFIGLLEEALDSSEYGLVFFDENSRMQRANKKATEYLPMLAGEDSASMGMDGFLDYLYDHALECDQSMRNAIYKSRENMSSHGFREVIQWRENRVCLIEAIKTKSKHVIYILRDISELRDQEEHVLRLHQSNHELTQAIEAAPGGIIISDPKEPGNPVIFVNDTFCAYTGFERADIIKQGWDFLSGFIQDKETEAQCFAALSGGETLDLETGIKKGDESQWFSVKLTPLFDDEGHPDLFIGVLSDITRLKMREAQFFQSQKLEALGQFSAGIAHDFNNILSIIDGYARIAVNPDFSTEQVSDYLGRIQKATKRGASLTKQMLTFSRHKIIDQQISDLGRVIDDQKVLLQPLISASVSFFIRMDEKQMNVKCRPDAIGQILMNLTINARDAMPDGGMLNIDLREVQTQNLPTSVPNDQRECAYACISVTDTGTGMDEKVLARIFDPFFTTKEQGKGTGLGMSVVYGLVQEMGGYINIESSLGSGTKIEIYIPLSDMKPEKQIVGDIEDIEDIKLEGYTVLVTEDEPDLLILVGDMLARLGMNVIRAAEGKEALLKQDEFEGDIDVLLTDVVMPEMNGVKLAELFKTLRPEAGVIFMSGYPAGGKDAPVQLPEGARFMAKPVEYDELTRLIYRRIKEKESGVYEDDAVEGPSWQVDDGDKTVKEPGAGSSEE